MEILRSFPANSAGAISLIQWTSDWDSLPNGSIIVIDEAQRLFRQRSISSAVPAYVQALETHRHKGFDIYIVTQHPMLIETHVRKLVEIHRHIMRKFGSSWVTVHEWKGTKENCDKSRKDSQETEFRYPREVFGWYKSAEVHTVRVRVPKKVLLLACLPIIIGVAAWIAWTRVGKTSNVPVAGVPGPQALPGRQGASQRPRMGTEEYLAQFEPRLAGLYHTASRYDEITKPVRAPVPVGCVLYDSEDGKGSFCITQQGTRFDPPIAFIQSFVERGMFVDFEPEANGGNGQGAGGQRQAKTDRTALQTERGPQRAE